MRRLSSRLTFFHKRVFPAVFVIVLGLSAAAVIERNREAAVPVLGFLLLAAAVMFLVLRKVVFDLCDEAWDEGAVLLLRKKGYELKVPLGAIQNVGYERWTKPQRVTLSLRDTTPLGNELSFALPVRLLPLSRNPLVDGLIERVDAARRRPAGGSNRAVTWTER
jgi:hypothetical protein